MIKKPGRHSGLAFVPRLNAVHRSRAGMAIVFTIMALVLLIGCRQASGSGIIVAGSTSVQPFAEILAEEYMRINPGITIDIQGGGSSAGIRAAESKTADIGMSSRALKESEADLWSVEIAKDGLALIVHPDNPISNLKLEQIRAIYTTTIHNWNQLGGASSEIHVVTREEGSGTRSAFEDLVMGGFEITPKALVQDSNGAVRQIVSDDPGAIGFISLGLVNDKVKAVQIGGIAATHDNIINGSYGLSRPFLFVAHDQPSGEALRFIDFVLSAEGRKILTVEGLVTAGEEP